MRKRFPFITQWQLEKTLAKAEEALNLVGYIPLLSVISASVRSVGGKLQALGGLLFALGCFGLGWFSPHHKKRKLFQLCRNGIEYLIHGLLNIFRSIFEAIPFLSLVTCLPYDRVLQKRFKYSLEEEPESSDVEIEV